MHTERERQRDSFKKGVPTPLKKELDRLNAYRERETKRENKRARERERERESEGERKKLRERARK